MRCSLRSQRDRARRPLRSACRRPLRALGFAASLPACAPRSPRPLAGGAALCAVLRRSRPHPARPRCACCRGSVGLSARSPLPRPRLSRRGSARARMGAKKASMPTVDAFVSLHKTRILYNCPKPAPRVVYTRRNLWGSAPVLPHRRRAFAISGASKIFFALAFLLIFLGGEVSKIFCSPTKSAFCLINECVEASRFLSGAVVLFFFCASFPRACCLRRRFRRSPFCFSCAPAPPRPAVGARTRACRRAECCFRQKLSKKPLTNVSGCDMIIMPAYRNGITN